LINALLHISGAGKDRHVESTSRQIWRAARSAGVATAHPGDHDDGDTDGHHPDPQSQIGSTWWYRRTTAAEPIGAAPQSR